MPDAWAPHQSAIAFEIRLVVLSGRDRGKLRLSTCPFRVRLRKRTAWVEPLCSVTLTVNFWPGEIAASGSLPSSMLRRRRWRSKLRLQRKIQRQIQRVPRLLLLFSQAHQDFLLLAACASLIFQNRQASRSPTTAARPHCPDLFPLRLWRLATCFRHLASSFAPPASNPEPGPANWYRFHQRNPSRGRLCP